jgi:plasmid stabilization system protein ParE
MLNQGKHDLNEIVSYLHVQGEDLPPLFQSELRDTVDYLRRFPKSFRQKRKGFREVQIGRFQILLIYKIHSETVWIHRLIHAARKPGSRYK